MQCGNTVLGLGRGHLAQCGNTVLGLGRGHLAQCGNTVLGLGRGHLSAVWQYCPRFLPLPFWRSVAASTVPGLGRGPSGAARVAKFVCGREFVMLCV